MKKGDAGYEAKLKYNREWRAENPEKQSAYERNYRLNNPEKERASARRLRVRDPQKSRSYVEKWRSKIPGRAITLIACAKRRATKRGEAFATTLAHVTTGLVRGTCPKTGVLFDLRVLKKGQNPYAPSLDRIDPTKPYSDDNSQVVCWAYNHMKGAMTEAQLLEFCQRVLDCGGR